jgi:hypothetical protein
MRAVRALTCGFGFAADQPWLPGLPHVAAALATYFVFGGQACATGLLLATLASFVVYLPVTALTLNGGRAITADAPAPALTTRAQMVLLGLWTLTAWAGAALASVAG